VDGVDEAAEIVTDEVDEAEEEEEDEMVVEEGEMVVEEDETLAEDEDEEAVVVATRSSSKASTFKTRMPSLHCKNIGYPFSVLYCNVC
jgi:hypothetical protein